MTINRSHIALNPIQWINVKENPADPNSADLWLFSEPSFRAQYPDVLAQIRRVGFDTVMMEVLDTQTLQDYQRMITEMDVSTSEMPLLGAHKQPMMDDDGKVIMKTVSRVKIKMPEKLAAIAQLASIMKWIGPSVLIDNRTINIAEMMTEGDSRLRKMEKSYEAGRIQEGQFKVTTGEKSHE